MQEVWRRASAQALADLKECLDFGTAAWIGLFARLGGAELLLQVCWYQEGGGSKPQHLLHLPQFLQPCPGFRLACALLHMHLNSIGLSRGWL